MPPTNVRLNAEMLVPQPSRLVPHPPEPIRKQMISGVYRSSTPLFGWSFELIYGSEELVDEEWINDFNTKYGALESATLSYEDTTGETVSKEVYIDQIIAPGIHWGSITERYTITLYECGEVIGS